MICMKSSYCNSHVRHWPRTVSKDEMQHRNFNVQCGTAVRFCIFRFCYLPPPSPCLHDQPLKSSPSFMSSFDGMTTPISEVKKRYMRSADQDVMESFKSLPEAGTRTVVWDKAPEWQRDNKYIIKGYRPGNTGYMGIVNSLTFSHNETCNIYTHLVGALLLPLIATGFMQVLSEPRFPTVSGRDYIVLGIFFCSAECCLVFSTAYHLLGCHSHGVEQFWLRMDLLGIVAVTIGTSVPGIYYVFACEPSLQKLHWTIVRLICGPHIPSLRQSLCANVDDRLSYLGPSPQL